MATAKEKAANKARKAELGYDEWGNPMPLPSKPTWANRHPRQAAMLSQAGGALERAFPLTAATAGAVAGGIESYMNPPQMYGENVGQAAAPGQGPFSSAAAVEMPLVRPGEMPPMPERNPGRDYQAMHNLGRAGALQQTIGGYIGDVNKEFGVDEATANTLLHNYADSSAGRAVTDVFIRGKRDRGLETKAREDYRNFVRDWVGLENKSRTVDVAKPVPVKASMLNNETSVAKIVRAVEKKPALVTDAADLGFSSDRVLVIPGDAPVEDPEAVLASPRTPVVSQRGFVDVMRYLRNN